MINTFIYLRLSIRSKTRIINLKQVIEKELYITPQNILFDGIEFDIRSITFNCDKNITIVNGYSSIDTGDSRPNYIPEKDIVDGKIDLFKEMVEKYKQLGWWEDV
jgi:hypothetical protein